MGKLGEDIACRYLTKHRFSIVERNYRKQWGEIDIIAQKKHTLHFVEVKTVSRANVTDVSGETKNDYRPEENVHPKKLERLARAVQSYMAEKDISMESVWQFDVLAVFLDRTKKQARVRFTENIVL